MRWPNWLSWSNSDTIIAIFLAFVASVYTLFSANLSVVTNSILAILGIIAISLIRERAAREKLVSSIDLLHRRSLTVPADNFFSNKSSEEIVIANAVSSLDFVQETGSLILEQFQDKIVDFVNRDGKVRMIVSSQSHRSTAHLSFRNENLPSREAIKQRSSLFISQIEYVTKKCLGKSLDVTVRFSEYDIGYTTVIADSKHPSIEGKGLFRLAGFRIPYSRKLDFHFISIESPKIVAHFAEEFETLFMGSSKFVLLEGRPRVGKTTIFQRLVDGVSAPPDLLFPVISREILEDGRRAGFEAVTGDGAVRRFATRKPGADAEETLESYDFDPSVWEDLCPSILAAAKARKIILLDEIGEMQMASRAFRHMIHTLLSDPGVVVFATISASDAPFLNEIRRHYRTNRHVMDEVNRPYILDVLSREMDGSVRLSEFRADAHE